MLVPRAALEALDSEVRRDSQVLEAMNVKGTRETWALQGAEAWTGPQGTSDLQGYGDQEPSLDLQDQSGPQVTLEPQESPVKWVILVITPARKVQMDPKAGQDHQVVRDLTCQ